MSVVHELLDSGLLEKERFVVEGHGDAHPLVPNDSSENRALNRRVEMTIQQGKRGDEIIDEPIGADLSPLATSPPQADLTGEAPRATQ